MVRKDIAAPTRGPARTVAGMDHTEEHSRRASSFGSQAAAYAKYRPDYPREALVWALEPVRDAPGLRVLDIGAGTGKLTGGLVALGVDVVAVEPDAAMLGELTSRFPGVTAAIGSAEDIPLPDDSVHGAFAGQALHWFDLERAVPEMARVLAPGGVLAGLWNMDDDRVPWVTGYKAAAGSRVSFKRLDTVRMPPSDGFFLPPAGAEFPHVQRRTAESLTATVATHSHVLVLTEQERTEVLDRVLGYLRTTPETAGGEFDLPIITMAGRARRA